MSTRRQTIKTLLISGIAAVVGPFIRASARNSEQTIGADGSVSADMAPAPKTALVVVDPYNDFMSEDGGAWLLVRLVAEDNGLVENLRHLVQVARRTGTTVAFAPHHRYREGSHSERTFPAPAQLQQIGSQAFATGEFGGEYVSGLEPQEDDIVSSEHSCSSGFAETNLHEQLQSRDITHLIVGGCISNTCIEATVRSGVDLGYHVTVVSDGIAAFSPVGHELALNESFPLVAHRVLTSVEAIKELEG
ncbi:MAG: isochorismatase family cysteine hydrolase [Parvibaculaceae bacterium]|uniref:isochorismatase family cysteine hydrolase n=1 Tax=Thalassospira sp. TaxID=1912094 RepID=UPI0032FAE51B